jgi:hypothetical protein
MRKRFVLAAVAAVAAIAVVWSVPHDIMVTQGSSLPVEFWSHPY